MFGAGSADFPPDVSRARRRYAVWMAAGMVVTMGLAALLVGLVSGSFPWAMLAFGCTALVWLTALVLLDVLGVAPPYVRPGK